jgi:hypothetical protein
MNLSKVKSIALKLCGEDNYYEELRLLKEDISFFTMYMQRNKKSHFTFNLRVSQLGSYWAFDKLWRSYEYGESYIEDVYAIFEVLKRMIVSIYEGAHTFTNAEIKEFNDWLRKNYDYDLRDFVTVFIGSSTGVAETINKISVMDVSTEDV